MEKILKTDAQVRREVLHSKVVSLHRRMVQDNPQAKPWSIYRSLGQKLGMSQQAIFLILKRYNAI